MRLSIVSTLYYSEPFLDEFVKRCVASAERSRSILRLSWSMTAHRMRRSRERSSYAQKSPASKLLNYRETLAITPRYLRVSPKPAAN